MKSESFNAIPKTINRTELYKVCKQIACFKLNFFDKTVDSCCHCVIT